ncbi:5-methylcytosine restriction system specificity protein McrC [Capnocytophaga granulosa]|uniref:5-methylcytosine restriction system specificity protein McrC n=1 Tax=Capnocytophaga granulosa TaxID=45242 RepID=UPI003857D844
MAIFLSEHREYILSKEDNLLFEALKTKQLRLFKTKKGEAIYPFLLWVSQEHITLKTDYYVGVDWLIGEEYIYVAPKMNHREEGVEINFLKMLLEIYTSDIEVKHTQDLIKIYWKEPQITIEQQKDFLTPFLVIQFLQLLKRIVRKGLKKSYYKEEENLCSRIKGKIQIGKHLKQNVFKNKLTSHICQYQAFGVDSIENRFLKKVLQFVISFKNTHSTLFAGNEAAIDELITYCTPYFELISEEFNVENLKNITINPFFKEYKEAIEIGKHILKRFSYNITETTQQKVAIPPFWIDMPKLFELYVYVKLQEQFGREAVTYHLTADYTELDFLLNTPTQKMVIDAKYKPVYEDSRVIDDIRQVSGYARLEKVYKRLGLEDSKELIDCLIIYPSLEENRVFNLENKSEIPEYRNIYKLGISIPLINVSSM